MKAAEQRRGLPLDDSDLWIAATALVMGATLVSTDSDFKTVEGLPACRVLNRSGEKAVSATDAHGYCLS